MPRSSVCRPQAWTAALRSAFRLDPALSATARRAFSTPRCQHNPSRCALGARDAASGALKSRIHPQRIRSDQLRHFSQTPRHSYKSVNEAKSRYRAGPFSLTSAILFFGVGAALIFYFRYEKDRVQRQKIAEQTKGVGRPKVGGPFDLVDQNGKRFTNEDMKGKYALVYFGFTHCPDICPEELDKMAEMIDRVKEVSGNTMRPIFITCDPARDTPAVMKTYLAEFHPDMIGLTGTWEAVKQVCKMYRVYFSTPPDVKPGQDYLVDHSIYFYLMDPEGDFVEALGRNETPARAAKIISDHIGDWKGPLNKD